MFVPRASDPGATSTRTRPDSPALLKGAPYLNFKHHTVGVAQLPAEVLINFPEIPLRAIAICADLEHNVFNPGRSRPVLTRARPLLCSRDPNG